MINIGLLSSKLFKKDGYTIPEICKNLGLKNTKFDIDEINYSRNSLNDEKIRWILLFGKKTKHNDTILFNRNFLKNNFVWDYAIIIDENMRICDIYEGYSYNYQYIEGRLETAYNGKTIVDNKIQEYVNERYRIHQSNNNERLRSMTKSLRGF